MTDIIETIAKYLAETYNGGDWNDYPDDAKKVHRARALAVNAMMRAWESQVSDLAWD